MGCQLSQIDSVLKPEVVLTILQIFERDWTELEWNYPLEIGKDRYIGSATSVRNSDKYLRFDASVIDIDDTISFPLMRVPRGYQRFWWFGKLANGTHIAPGNYRYSASSKKPSVRFD